MIDGDLGQLKEDAFYLTSPGSLSYIQTTPLVSCEDISHSG